MISNPGTGKRFFDRDGNEVKVEKLADLDPAIRKFENMMLGYFGLKNPKALYKLREIVELSRELFEE